MTAITIHAIYQDGILKPTTALDLPEGATVEVQITPVLSAAPPSLTAFGSLAGIWRHLSQADLEQIEQGIRDIREQAAAKLRRLAREL